MDIDSQEPPRKTSQLTLRELAFAVTMLCIGLGAVRTILILVCPLIYFYFVTSWLSTRTSLTIGRALLLSMIISVTISLCLVATALDYTKIYQSYSTESRGLALPRTMELGVALGLIVTWYFGQLIPWAVIWYCSDVYRESTKKSTSPAPTSADHQTKKYQ